MAPNDLVMSIFMPLALMSKDDVSKDELENVGQIIGDMKDTFPRSVNGYPIFHTCRFIDKKDWAIIIAKVNLMKKAIAKVERENTRVPKEDYVI
jgi:hypothetical protein